jgi:hypothetical protein
MIIRYTLEKEDEVMHGNTKKALVGWMNGWAGGCIVP